MARRAYPSGRAPGGWTFLEPVALEMRGKAPGHRKLLELGPKLFEASEGGSGGPKDLVLAVRTDGDRGDERVLGLPVPDEVLGGPTYELDHFLPGAGEFGLFQRLVQPMDTDRPFGSFIESGLDLPLQVGGYPGMGFHREYQWEGGVENPLDNRGLNLRRILGQRNGPRVPSCPGGMRTGSPSTGRVARSAR